MFSQRFYSALTQFIRSPSAKLVTFVRRRKQEALLNCYQGFRCANPRALLVRIREFTPTLINT